MKRSFDGLLFNSMKDIEKTSTLEEVITLLTFNNKTTDDYEKLLCGCANLAEVFRKVSKFVSFFDYDLVKLLIQTLGSKSLKQQLNKYKKRFQEFSKRRVCQLPSDALGDDAEKSENVFGIKCDKNVETLTVEEVQKLEYEMNKIMGHKLLRLLKIEEGCVKLTFRSFEDCEFEITYGQRQALKKLDVLSISYGDQVVQISFPSTQFGELKCIQARASDMSMLHEPPLEVVLAIRFVGMLLGMYISYQTIYTFCSPLHHTL